jgi:predicted flap endonuclease-1-like 5' DNA nuclease
MFQDSPFSGACTYSTVEVLIMLVGTFLLGLLLGYLIWGFLKRKLEELEKRIYEFEHSLTLKNDQIDELEKKNSLLQEENDQAQRELNRKSGQYTDSLTTIKALTGEVEALKGKVSASIKDTSVSSVTSTGKGKSAAKKSVNPLRIGSTKTSLGKAAGIYGRTIIANDLKLIEGIGPKIEEIFKKKGIRTWARLAESKVADLRDILEKAGSRFSLHNPATWPRQSRMAAKGEWKKLKAYQDKLKGGRE